MAEDDQKFSHDEDQSATESEVDSPEELPVDTAENAPAPRMGMLKATAGLLVSAYILIISLVKVDDAFFHSNEPEVLHNANNLIWSPLAVVGVPLGVVLVALYLRRIWQILRGGKQT